MVFSIPASVGGAIALQFNAHLDEFRTPPWQRARNERNTRETSRREHEALTENDRNIIKYTVLHDENILFLLFYDVYYVLRPCSRLHMTTAFTLPSDRIFDDKYYQ